MSCLVCHELLVPAAAIAHAQELLVIPAAIAHAQNESRHTAVNVQLQKRIRW